MCLTCSIVPTCVTPTQQCNSVNTGALWLTFTENGSQTCKMGLFFSRGQDGGRAARLESPAVVASYKALPGEFGIELSRTLTCAE